MVLDFSNIFVLIYLIGKVFTFALNNILEYIDYSFRKRNGGTLPKKLQEIETARTVFDKEKLKKISDYENEKYILWIPQCITEFMLTMALVLFGFYPWLFSVIGNLHWINECGFLHVFFFLILSGIPSSIAELPFSIYKEFKIEKKYGFSNMSLKLWLIDQLKSFVVSLVFGFILVFAIVFLLNKFNSFWWLLLAGVMIAFSFIMMIIYPKFIAPLFNKFSPLEDAELKQKIQTLFEKTGFVSSGIFVMDASKRSNHSNAYFSGFGKTKRIVLYDTLMKQLSDDELIAVLGHELGHYKLKHIVKRLVVLLPMEFIVMFILFLLAQNVSLYNSFGFNFINAGNISNYQFLGLMLSSMLYEAVTIIISPLSAISSRRQEYQADKFSSQVCGTPDNLITALIKLNSENLSELLPPKIYSFFMYSHPTLIERIEALEKTKESKK